MKNYIYQVIGAMDYNDAILDGIEIGNVLEIPANTLNEALKRFIYFAGDISEVAEEESLITGAVVIRTHQAEYTFCQRFGCPHVWGLVDMQEWQPSCIDKYGDIVVGFTQEEYNDLLESKAAENSLRWQVSTYLSR